MDLNNSQASDGELEKFLTVEKVKTQFHEQVSVTSYWLL